MTCSAAKRITGRWAGIVILALSPTVANAVTLEELEARIVRLEQALKRSEQERRELRKIVEAVRMLEQPLEKQATGRVETAGSPFNFFVFSTLLPFLSLPKTVSSRNRQKTGPSWPAP